MKCTNCFSNHVIFDEGNGENVCTGCGAVEPVRIEERRKWDGLKTTHHQFSQSRNRIAFRPTMVGGGYGDKGGRLRFIDKTVKINVPTAVKKVNFYVNLLSERLGIDHCQSVKERAIVFYKKYYAKKGAPKVSDSNIVASVCLYLAIKEFGLPKSFRDIQRVMRDERIGGDQKNVRCFFKIQFDMQSILDLKFDTNPSLPSTLTSSFARQMGLPLSIEREAIEVIENIRDEPWFYCRSPKDVAAASLWYVFYHLGSGPRDQFRQEEFASIASGNVITLRRIVKEIISSQRIKEEEMRYQNHAEEGKEEEGKSQKEKGEPILVGIPQLGGRTSV